MKNPLAVIAFGGNAILKDSERGTQEEQMRHTDESPAARTTNATRDEAFWTGSMGARVSDWIGDAALLRIDDVHHKIALFPSNHPGIQHVNFQVSSMDDIMRSYYHLKAHGVRIVFGPGRHPTSGARFLYFQGPDAVIYEYSWGVRSISAEEEPTYVPRRFPKRSSSFCMWGALPDIEGPVLSLDFVAPRIGWAASP